MQDQDKTKEQLIDELNEFRRKVALIDVAENKLRKSQGLSPRLEDKTSEEIIHELQVHQIELEMQNDELRRTQLELEESRDKFQSLYDFSPVGYFTLTHKGFITDVNLTGAALLGMPRTKLINMRFGRFVAPECQDQWHHCMVSILKQEARQVCDLTLKCEDGPSFYVCLESIKTDAPIQKQAKNGAPYLVRMAVSDITEKKRILDELNRALNLASMLQTHAEATSSAKSKFLTNMSHELRTPLTAVIGFSSLLEDQLVGQLNEKQLGYVTEISAAGRHLLRLISDILDLAKVESGKMDLRTSLIDLSELTRGCLSIIRETAIKKGLALELDISDELSQGNNIRADSVRLKQIIVNLLSNAAKFTPLGGVIRLEARKQGNEILLSVSDTGIGIKPHDKERIFQEFEQVDSSFSRQEEGTGLGLSLSRRLVELHGGRIWVESEGENKGSVFSFTIPFVDASKQETESILLSKTDDGLHTRLRWALSSEGDNMPTVMVVEDNTSNMILATNLLEAGGYNLYSRHSPLKRQ